MASDDAVPLTELDVITRWSLAVRQPSVDRAELISVLRSDLAFLEGTPEPQPESDPEQAPAPLAAPLPVKRSPRKAAATKPPVTAAIPAKPRATRSIPSPKTAKTVTTAKTASRRPSTGG